MNNGIFVQDSYSRGKFGNDLPMPMRGAQNSIPLPYSHGNSNKNPNNFILVIDTTKETNTNIILSFPYGINANSIVDWGDGFTDNIRTSISSITHTYDLHGTYIIQIISTGFSFWNNGVATRNKIIRCLSFGSANFLQYAFRGCANLIEIPESLSGFIQNVDGMFDGCVQLRRGGRQWNASLLPSSLSAMFGSSASYNEDISSWNMSGKNNLSYLFAGASSFNQYIGNWNTSTVSNMNHMFNGATSFNQNIDLWNTSSVSQMDSMFVNASSFNSSLNFNTSNVTLMGNMFNGARSFNQPINSWNTANVTNMGNMFFGAVSFNQPLNNWNVSKVTSFADMFNNARSFNGNMSGWQLIANGVSCAGMFNHFGWGPGGALATDNGFETWNTSGVVNMSRMFESQKQFNADLGLWNTINVTNMSRMFLQSSVFNNGNSSTINNWNTSNVTDMSSMFRDALVFNQPLNNWNTGKVTNFGDTFGYASQFNQPLNNWNVRKVTNFAGMFQGATNFNSSLSGWALGADTAGTTCASMFADCPSFNQDIGNWDVSKVTNMNFMFGRNTAVVSGFNNGGSPSISGWNTSNVTNMALMFANINNFNQPIGSWNVSKVTTMTSMLQNAMAFNQDISGWNLAGLNANTALDSFMSGKVGSNALSTANYDALLIGWNNNKLASANGVANWRTDLRPNFGGAKYTAGGAAAAARAALVSYGWTITDGGTA